MSQLRTSTLGPQGEFTQSRSPTPDCDDEHGLPRVLVLLAAFNGAQWIREQLNSILRQTGVDVRVVVGDDGSSDSTLQVVGQLVASDSRIVKADGAVPSGSAGQN